MNISDPLDRETLERRAEAALAEQLVPGIVGNPFLDHVPTPRQADFLRAHLDHPSADGEVVEALYGGANGGGKSNALLFAAAQFFHVPGYAAIIFRRSYQDLAQPGAIMHRAIEWWGNRPDVKWNKTDRTFTFPSGAQLTFGYMLNREDRNNYAGAEYQYVGWDELTQFPFEEDYEFIGLGRCRRTTRLADFDVPLRCYSATNPGGVGHNWVRDRFDVFETGDPDLLPFYPAKVHDNPYIDQGYKRSLMRLGFLDRSRLLEGSWSAREPGSYFRREWFGPFLEQSDRWPSRDCRRVRWWDLAASEAKDACHTAGVKAARHLNGSYMIEHCLSFRATPGARDAAIVSTALADGPTVVVGLEVEPGSGGIAQVENIRERLRKHGIRCEYARPRAEQDHRERIYVQRSRGNLGAKARRCEPVSTCLQRGYVLRGEGPAEDEATGNAFPEWGTETGRSPAEASDGIRILAGTWTSDFLDVLEPFPGERGQRVDEVDALAGAWLWLKSHPVGDKKPGGGRPSRALTYTADDWRRTNPSERPSLAESGRDRSGRWRP